MTWQSTAEPATGLLVRIRVVEVVEVGWGWNLGPVQPGNATALQQLQEDHETKVSEAPNVQIQSCSCNKKQTM